jgi:hypothetical protein
MAFSPYFFFGLRSALIALSRLIVENYFHCGGREIDYIEAFVTIPHEFAALIVGLG